MINKIALANSCVELLEGKLGMFMKRMSLEKTKERFPKGKQEIENGQFNKFQIPQLDS